MNVPAPLKPDNTVLVLIDFQERLFPVMHDKEKLLRNVVKLIKGATGAGDTDNPHRAVPQRTGPDYPGD